MAVDPNAGTSTLLPPSSEEGSAHPRPVVVEGNGEHAISLTAVATLSSEHQRRLELLEIEHKQRMEYARIEHERRMEVIEAEAFLADEKCRLLAEEIAPSNDRLRAMAGKFTAPAGTFDHEEMPY